MFLLRLRPQRQRRHQRFRLRLQANPELSLQPSPSQDQRPSLRLLRKMASSAQYRPPRSRKFSPLRSLSSRLCRRPYHSLHSNQRHNPPRSLRRR